MTALQELIAYIKEDPWDNKGKGDILNKAESLLDKEKRDLKEAWTSGKSSDYYETSESYINKKYNHAKIHN
jgi:hypothetical protein